MKRVFTKIAAGVAMVVAASSAHAVLSSASLLMLNENDAVTTFGVDPAGSPTASASWYVSSDGAGLDSFFTMGGSKTKTLVDGQFAYLYNGSALTLNGSTQAGINTFTYYGAPGSNETLGSGISILSASGDTATVNMSGWKVDWGTVQDIPMGSGAWSAGYTSGVGNITCSAGSGCAVGSTYTLKYTATVPAGDASGFGTVKYYLELHGCMQAAPCPSPTTIPTIPEVSTYGMMLAGLGLVGFMARRRKQAEA